MWHHHRACAGDKRKIWHRRCKSIWRLPWTSKRRSGCCICNYPKPFPCRNLYSSNGGRKRCHVWEANGKKLCRSTEDGRNCWKNTQSSQHSISEPLSYRFTVSEGNVQKWWIGRNLFCQSTCTQKKSCSDLGCVPEWRRTGRRSSDWYWYTCTGSDIMDDG